MRTLLAKILFVIGVTALCGGCIRYQPVYNVDADRFAGPAAPLELRAATIKSAATGLGWISEVTEPGKIKATLNLRTHQAVVMISYTPETFSIQYVSSVDLNYNGGLIHPNYNGWIQNLDRAIKTASAA